MRCPRTKGRYAVPSRWPVVSRRGNGTGALIICLLDDCRRAPPEDARHGVVRARDLISRNFASENALRALLAPLLTEIPRSAAASHVPQPFLLKAFEFNHRNARFRQKGRLSFLVCLYRAYPVVTPTHAGKTRPKLFQLRPLSPEPAQAAPW